MINTAWKISELREHALKINSDEIISLIDSISRNVEIFLYHRITTEESLTGNINYESPENVENFLLIFGCSEQQADFRRKVIIIEANLIGCAHTTRNSVEIFAQLLNCIILNKKISTDKCEPFEVLKKLPPGELKEKFDALLNSEWFKYLSAFTNTIKHQKLIQTQTTISVEEENVGFKVRKFSHKKITYQEYWVNDFLLGLSFVKKQVIELGCILNNTCLTLQSTGTVQS